MKGSIALTIAAIAGEPGLYDKKVCGPGIGIVSEESLTGPKETAELVSVTD
jgi:hypothetical protein